MRGTVLRGTELIRRHAMQTNVRAGRNSVLMVLAIGAVLVLGGLAIAQQKEPMQRGNEIGMSMMTPTQVSMLFKNTKHTLAENISAAEKSCGGRAVQAQCCYQGVMGQPAEGTSGRTVVCVVTLLVGDNRLVEAIVNTQTGEIINKHDVNALTYMGMGRSDDLAMAQRWQKATELRGKKVTNANGEDLGKLEDIVTDPQSGRIVFGVVSFGGLLGLGDRFFTIPWSALQLTGDAKTFILNVDQDRLKNATSFTSDHWPNFADEQFAAATYKYYGQRPYWQMEAAEVRPMAEETAMPDDYRAHWYARPMDCQKISDLCRKDVRTAQTEDVGKLNDLAIDPDHGRILYAILSYRDKLFAIPWNALNLTTDAQHFVLNIDKSQLTDAVAFNNYNWPNPIDPTWATETYVHYNVEPYWTAPRGETSVRR
jgi:sporulation protein YlmC with PRC-barrel domain